MSINKHIGLVESRDKSDVCRSNKRSIERGFSDRFEQLAIANKCLLI